MSISSASKYQSIYLLTSVVCSPGEDSRTARRRRLIRLSSHLTWTFLVAALLNRPYLPYLPGGFRKVQQVVPFQIRQLLGDRWSDIKKMMVSKDAHSKIRSFSASPELETWLLLEGSSLEKSVACGGLIDLEDAGPLIRRPRANTC